MDIYSEQAEFAFQFQASLEESPGQITNIGPVKMQTPTRAARGALVALILGLGLALIGAMILVGGNAHVTDKTLTGDLFGLLSAVFSAIYTLSLTKVRTRLPVSIVMASVAAVSTLLLWILAGIFLTQAGDDLKRRFQTRWFTARRQSAFA